MTGNPNAVLTQPVIDGVLAAARAGVERFTPDATWAAMQQGALVVDTRTDAQRSEQGDLPGVVVIDRTVLEWRLDPTSPHRIPEAVDASMLVIVICREGYSSSLAAASLRAIGLSRATDMAGGVDAWLSAGLPLTSSCADVRR